MTPARLLVFRCVLLCVSALWLQPASVTRAQSVEMAGAARAGGGAGVAVAVLDMRERDRTSDVRLAALRTTAGIWEGLLDVRLARSATLGLAGAATLELTGAVRTDAQAALRLAGQGVLGPVSLRLAATAATDGPGAFHITGLAPADPRPRVDGFAVTLDALARWRIDRSLLLTLDPAVVVMDAGAGARLDGSLRIRRLAGDLDGVMAWHAWLDPETDALSGAVGVAAVLAPRRAPEWHAALWLGWADGSVAPGATLRGSGALIEGVDVAVDLAAEPFRRDVPPYRAAAELRAELGGPEGFVRAQLEADPSAAVPFAAAVAVGARVAVERRTVERR